MRWPWSKPRSLLRELVDDEWFTRDAGAALLDAALRVRRAGLEHLVDRATPAEVDVLVKAGEILEAESALLRFLAFNEPTLVASVFDGGDLRLTALLDRALDSATRPKRKA